MRRTTALLVCIALFLAACGAGGEQEPEPSPSSSVAPATSVSRPSTTGDNAVARPVAFTPSPGVERAVPSPDAPVTDLAAGFNDAGFALWRTLPAADNIVFSPTSIGHALLMARAAADEPTGHAIDAAFGLPQGMSAHQAWNAIDQTLAGVATGEPDVTITIADRIWPRIDVTPDQAWIDLLAAEHGATSVPLDFAGDADGSRAVINDWVGEQTAGLIPELLPPGFIQPKTTLVLTDAIYFKARWQTVFGKYGTERADFTLLDGATVPTELMIHREVGDVRGVGEGFVGAEIPYIADSLSMLLIVPDEGRFDEVRERLSQDVLDEIDSTFEPGPYELQMPQWKSKTQVNLIPWLRQIGAAPGLYPSITPGSFLDSAVHGADIAVDDIGTVAAAATALGFDESAADPGDLTVRADRPYLYLIRHRPTGLVLFAGQVTNPAA